MRTLLRQPLLHFLLLGAALFGVYGLVRPAPSDPAGQIVVTRSQVERLAIGFTRTWQRPPTPEELTGLVGDRIREEVLYREALAMGLDRDDTIVRRRLRQKLEFLIPDLASPGAPPTEQEMQAYLDRHADKYGAEPAVSFEQVFFNRERRGKSAWVDAESTLTRLNGPGGSAVSLDAVGDASLLPIELTGSSEREVTKLFGKKFNRGLAQVSVGRWTGPLESSYGVHVVLVRARVPGRVPELASVRDVVLRDLQSEHRQQALDAAYTKLLARYTVVVEPLALAQGARASDP